MDRSIKIWGLQSTQPCLTLEGHDLGVNCIDYSTGGEKSYLLSGADDKTCRVWDYQDGTCVEVLVGHKNNVTFAVFHPDLPIILTGSEDGSVCTWHSNTYKLKNTLNYGIGRPWSVAVFKGMQKVGLGYDEGMALIEIGDEVPGSSVPGEELRAQIVAVADMIRAMKVVKVRLCCNLLPLSCPAKGGLGRRQSLR